MKRANGKRHALRPIQLWSLPMLALVVLSLRLLMAVIRWGGSYVFLGLKEPSTALLIGLGAVALVALGFWRLRKTSLSKIVFVVAVLLAFMVSAAGEGYLLLDLAGCC